MSKISHALGRLRSYQVASSIWDDLPVSRRAGVLVLLYSNKNKELASLLTLRSRNLSSYSGDAALPGGKADSINETPYEVARREAFEEIGLPFSDEELENKGYIMEHVTTLPAYLSRNLLAVRPVVAYMRSIHEGHHHNQQHHDEDHHHHHDHVKDLPSIIDLDTHKSDEVADIFSVPLQRFLSNSPGWYSSKSVNWGGLKWNQHWYRAIRPVKPVGQTGWYSVWGLTANILLDTASIAFDTVPPMPHRRKGLIGDEVLLQGLKEHGLLTLKRDRKKDNSVIFSRIFGPDSPLLRERCADDS